MSLTGRILLASALVVASQVLVVALHRGTDPQPSKLPQLGPNTLPSAVGDFQGIEEPLDVRIVAQANADLMLNRTYKNRLGDVVHVNVGIWLDFGRGIPHPPDLCYPSAGWEIINRDASHVELEGQEALRVKRYAFQRDTSRVAVVYWAQLGNDIVINAEEVRPILQRLRNNGEGLPPMVKVMLHTDATDIEQANARLNRFASALFPHTQAIR